MYVENLSVSRLLRLRDLYFVSQVVRVLGRLNNQSVIQLFLLEKVEKSARLEQDHGICLARAGQAGKGTCIET